MNPNCFGPVLLALVCPCIMKPEENIVKPSGPKLCGSRCNDMVGCDSYTYVTSDLSCQLANVISGKGRLSEETVFRIARKKYRRYVEANMTCRKNAKIFHTRKNHLRCMLRWSQQTHQGKLTRLLMLPSSKYKHPLPGRQLYFHNNSVVIYPYIRTVKVMAVAYISALRKIIASTFRPNRLFFTPLDDRRKTFIHRKDIFFAITVDDFKQVIFLTSLNTTGFTFDVRAMTTRGTNLTSLVNIDCKARGIAADSKRSMLFLVCHKRKIAQYTYQGEFVKDVVTGFILYSLNIDVENDILYYMADQQSTTIFQISLGNNSITNVTSLTFKAGYFYVLGNAFYVTPTKFVNELMVVTRNGNVTKIDTNIPGSMKLSFCTIP